MIKIYKAFVGTVLLGIFCFFPWSVSAAPKDFKGLLAERRVNLWVEGEALGDLMIGSRGQMEFIYVDKPLIDRARKEGWGSVPDWFRKECQYFGSPELKGKDLFVVRYKALLPWDFSPEELRFGEYSVTWKDVLTNKAFFLYGEVPSGAHGDFAVGISKGGSKNIPIAYGDYETTFTFPGR